MSRLHYKYINHIDAGTVFRFSSQEPNLPATNIQNEIKGKVWRTDSGFVVTPYNQHVPFRDTATTTVFDYVIPSGTYTGSGLASILQTGLNSVGTFADHIASYDSATEKFNIGRTSTSVGLFALLFSATDYIFNTQAITLGFTFGKSLIGSPNYTSSAPVLAGDNEIIIQLTGTANVNSLIIDNHNFDSGTVLRMRGSKSTATVFSGGWNTTAPITLSQTVSWYSSIISIEITQTSIKSIQLYWYDRRNSYNDIGRMYAGVYFEQTFAQDNIISFTRKTIERRSKQMKAESGATYFDKRDSIVDYLIPVPPLDEFFDAATKTGYEDMLDNVGNDKSFWITLDDEDLNAETVYGFIVGNTSFERLARNTPTFIHEDLIFREQK